MPKIKQVAAKSSGRGKNVDLSSTSVPIPEIPAASKKKSMLAERGFNLESPNPDFLSTVATLGWHKFILHRKEFIPSLVHDFYRGIVDRNDGVPPSIAIVRGEEVKFSARVINDYFGLGYYGKAVETKQKTYGAAEMARVKERICVDGAVWERHGDHGNEFKILKKYLTEEANTWFHFIRHSLVPTSHNVWVDKERLIILDAIITGDKIEVGKLINREINKYKNRKDGLLYFPCLITDLCMEAGVEIQPSELREEPQGAFSTKFKAKQRPVDVTTSVDTQTLQRLIQQQNSLGLFVKKQFEWQKKVNAHLTKGKMVIEEPVMPEWMKELEEEEEEDNAPLAARLKAVKKERVKRGRSPVKSRKSPAKKKQKKVSSEEEELHSAEMIEISEEDEEESKKVSMEVLSEEEEEEGTHSEEGSSGDQSDFAADPPPTQTLNKPTQKPASPKSQSPTKTTTHDQSTPQSKAQDQPLPQPSPIQPEETQQPSHQQEPSGSHPEQDPKTQPKKQRVKHVPTRSPFGRKRRAELAAVSEEPKDDEAQAQPADDDATKREKLQVRKKSQAQKGKPATITSAAFVPTSDVDAATVVVSGEGVADVTTSAEREAADKLAELQALKAHEAAVEKAKEQALGEATQQLAEQLLKEAQDRAAAIGDVSADVPTSKEPEVEKAQAEPKEPEQADPEELAKQKSWEEAKKRIAETSAKVTQQAAASSGGVRSEETTTTEVGGEEQKKKERKKKGAGTGVKPVRQSGRLRSGVLPK